MYAPGLSKTQYRWGSSIAVLAIAAAVAYFTFFMPTSAAQTHVIEMKNGELAPSQLTVIEGDTVTFKNAGESNVWPASDPHPTHEYLGGFDPGRLLSPGDEWSYTMTEPGTWRLHDHLSPSVHGEIIVVARSASASDQTYESGCDGQCFDDLIKTVVERDGVDAAYALFQKSYNEGVLPRSCHWTAHRIGEAAFDRYKADGEVSLSPATSFCGFGFYHGFLEKLLREDPSPAYALEFCKSVEEKLGRMGLQNCYHGIGHGYTEDPPERSAEGSFEKMTAAGVELCEYLFGKNFTNFNLCLTGVYTVPAGFAAKNEFGLSLDPKKPFAYCEDLPERHLKACYGEFAPKLDHVLQWDIAALPAYVDAIQDDRLKRLVVWVVPSVFMAKHIQDGILDRYITGCRDSFSGSYRNICWGGAILGIFSHGEPLKQYKKAFAFCSSGAWRSDERAFCWGEALRQARQTYGTSNMAKMCADVPRDYSHLCMDEANVHESPYDDPSFE